MNSEAPAYGLWSLVVINSVVFILFAYSFFKPQTTRDWRSFSAFSAFLVALFAEMYGFPLTIYFLSGWLQSRYPDIDWFSHDAGHLLEMVFGWKTNPHAGPFHILSFVFIGGGFTLIAVAWKVLYEAQQKRVLAITGPYSYVRHPQYVGFILVMFGFLLQWPTILTLAMFPVLTVMYVRLARSEEKVAVAEFGDAYTRYVAEVPGFIPKLSRLMRQESSGGTVMANRLTSIALLGALAMAGSFGGVTNAVETDLAKTSGGVTVYLGVVPAEIIKGLAVGRRIVGPMHSSIPEGPHEYHLVAAVFDAASGARISDAAVTAEVSGLGLSASRAGRSRCRFPAL